jgi:hypothetical protein
MALTPTKWTQHFGDFTGYGAAVLVLGAVAWSATPLRARPRTFAAGLAAATAVAAVVLAGYNLWPYQGAWFTPTFSTLAPQIAGVGVATFVGVAGGGIVAVLLVRSTWQVAGGRPESLVPRRLPGPAPLVALVLGAVLALQMLIVVRVAVTHRDSYTLAADTVSTLRGQPCGLQERLSVETNPAAGLLPLAEGSPGRTIPVDVGGRTLPGVEVAGRVSTAWYALDPGQRNQALPVVVTTSGPLRPGDGLFLEFGDGSRLLERRPIAPRHPVQDDIRELAPTGADTVRLAVDAPAAARASASASLPRVPRLTPMTHLLPPGSNALLDWPIAFLFPCLRPEALPLGTAAVPEWRVGPPADDTETHITYLSEYGGPFVGPRLLVTEQRMPTYLAGDPLRDAAQVYQWVPIRPLARHEPVVTDRTVTGWHHEGHTRIPGIDPVE